MGIPAAAAAASESLLIEQSDLRKLQNGGSCREIGRPDEENHAAAEVSSISQIINYGLKTTAPDEFGTIVVDTSSLPSDPATFSNLLEISLKQWRKQPGTKSVLLKLPVHNSDNLADSALQAGFEWRDAKFGCTMLVAWLSE